MTASLTRSEGKTVPHVAYGSVSRLGWTLEVRSRTQITDVPCHVSQTWHLIWVSLALLMRSERYGKVGLAAVTGGPRMLSHRMCVCMRVYIGAYIWALCASCMYRRSRSTVLHMMPADRVRVLYYEVKWHRSSEGFGIKLIHLLPLAYSNSVGVAYTRLKAYLIYVQSIRVIEITKVMLPKDTKFKWECKCIEIRVRTVKLLSKNKGGQRGNIRTTAAAVTESWLLHACSWINCLPNESKEKY